MRIACIHIPQYALQCAIRLNPSLRGTPVAVVGTPAAEIAASQPAPVVTACSRAAWNLGVRLGMTAAGARSIAPSVSIVSAEQTLESETARAVAEALLGVSRTVELGARVGPGGAHLAMYVEVPANVRGTSFANRALERLDVMGTTCRVGIADDRFTAWVAASRGVGAQTRTGRSVRDVAVVPRGGSAAFLAPLPLTLLQLTIEVQHMLEALGVHTLGEFAALPSPSIAPRPQVFEADYQALARGESGTRLRPFVPRGTICEDIIVGAGNVLDQADSICGSTAASQLARRIALRLEGRGSQATRLRISASLERDPRRFDEDAWKSLTKNGAGIIEVDLDDATVAPEKLARALIPIAARTTTEPWQLSVMVVGERPCAPVPTPVAVAPSGRSNAEFHAGPASAAAESVIHPLALVLSTPGTLFSMSGTKDRSHRRTRRSRQRRVFARPPDGQSELFGSR